MRLSQNWEKGWLRDKPLIENKKHELYNKIIDYQLSDLRIGKNTISISVGRPRSGKSYFSIWLMLFFNYCWFSDESCEPDPGNIEPLKYCFWDLKKFMMATLDEKNSNRFLVFEEIGTSKGTWDYRNIELQNLNRLEQIFGVDNTNTINNIPALYAVEKTQRLKANYIYELQRFSPTHFRARLYTKWTSPTTEKAKFRYANYYWDNLPDVRAKFPELIAKYEELKRAFNKKKKLEYTGGTYGAEKTISLNYKPIST